jgi:hypothetical protein
MMNLDEMYATALVNRQTREPIDVMRDGSERLNLPEGRETVEQTAPGEITHTYTRQPDGTMRIDIANVGDEARDQQVTAPPDGVRPPTAAGLSPGTPEFAQDMVEQMFAGGYPEGAAPMSARRFIETAADVPAGIAKGAVQGTLGFPGDVVAIGRGIAAAVNPQQGETRLGAFLRAIGDPVEAFGYNITTEGMKKLLEGALGPLVPEGSDPRRVEAARTAETVGEIGAMGQLATQTARGAAQGVRAIGQEIATTPPTGAVQLAPTPVQAPRSKLGFYSAVEETVANLPQAKGTGQQFLAQISKTAGVKPEEIQWTGLDEFLKGKKSVTKQEVQDYLSANKVDVQEVQLGGNRMFTDPDEAINFIAMRQGTTAAEVIDDYGYRDTNDYTTLAQQFMPRSADEWQGAIDRAEAAGDWGQAERLNNAWEASEGFGPAGSTKFSQYTLPGGQNYREILLTLPDTKGARLDARRAEIEAKGRNATDAEKQEWVSIMNQLQPETRDVEGLSPFRNRPEFRTTHFDQPNILAHLRVNDRTVDGKKTLFIEEIQSDWHQAGRKKGYGPQTETEAYYITPDGSRVSLGFGKTQEEAAAAVDPGWKNLVDIKFDTQTKKFGEGVPDAPFKTSWHELSLKRAIQEAAEKGYDQIAFTTGKTQAERYALSKSVDDVSWTSREKGGRLVVLSLKEQGAVQLIVDDNGVVTKAANLRNARGKNLDDLIGKDLSKKIMEESGGSLGGVELDVGGEGMKGFYDNILPKSLDKLGKKFDAKVGKTFIEGERTRDADGFPSMYPEKIEVWKMDITPKMRESVVSKGQPLFVAPIVAPGMMQEEETK